MDEHWVGHEGYPADPTEKEEYIQRMRGIAGETSIDVLHNGRIVNKTFPIGGGIMVGDPVGLDTKGRLHVADPLGPQCLGVVESVDKATGIASVRITRNGRAPQARGQRTVGTVWEEELAYIRSAGQVQPHYVVHEDGRVERYVP